MNPSENDQQQVCQPCLTKQALKVRISFFFDGTLNNMENVRAGTPDKGGSYANDLTNVVRLYDALLPESDSFAHHLTIYTEGVGTEDRKEDHRKIGGGLGMGPTGVKNKAEAGWNSGLKIMKAEGIDISAQLDITIDVFGFSRGAACARYFIYKFLNDHDNFRNQPAVEFGYHTIMQCRCRYIGLFDTVASYGLMHKNDTADLNLKAIQLAETGLHLCAAEEHRENFRLTDTRSNSSVLELFLPGVHSDIGGGYPPQDSEEQWEVYIPGGFWSLFSSRKTRKKAIRRQKKWLTDRRWYEDTELTVDGDYKKLIAKRQKIYNNYTYIPMHMMADHSKQKGGLKYDLMALEKHAIPEDLTDLKKTLETCLNQGTHYDWMNDTSTEMQKVRHKYFHFSARYNGIGHNPQWSDKGSIDGKRQRIIQEG
ncbi:MAG: DUF2235 domain-containing protein [Pseudomonadota bacterium]